MRCASNLYPLEVAVVRIVAARFAGSGPLRTLCFIFLFCFRAYGAVLLSSILILLSDLRFSRLFQKYLEHRLGDKFSVTYSLNVGNGLTILAVSICVNK